MFSFLDELKSGIDKIVSENQYEDLQSERNSYYDLYDRVKYIINDLKTSLNYLNSVSKKVIEGYSVDDISGDDGFLDNLRIDIQDTYDYLNNNILPSIEKKIKELFDVIDKIDIGGEL